MPQKSYIGILFIVIACLSNALMASFVKLISIHYTLPNQVLVFMRFAISFILLQPILFIRKKRPLKEELTIKVWPPHAVRILVGQLALYAYFYAIQTISLSSAVLLTYTSPIFVPLIVWVWKGVMVEKRIWWGIIIGFIGVFVVVGPGFEKLEIGYLVGLLSGVCAAISYVALQAQTHNNSPLCINFYFFLGTSLLALLLCFKLLFLIQWDLQLILMLVAMGLFGALFQTFMTLGVKRIHVRFVSAYLYLSVAFSMILSWLIFDTPPTLTTYIGLSLILAGVVLNIILDPRRKGTQTES